MSKSKSKLRTHDARLAIIEDTVIKPPAPDIPTDAVAFARSIGFICDPWQETVLHSTSNRLAICASRQSGKTVCTSLKALHSALINADKSIIILSPSERQSKIMFVALMKHYEQANRPLFKSETTLSLDLTNGSSIIALPASENTIRGHHCDLLLVDEMARVPDELYYSAMPFVAVTHGAIIAMSTPFGERGAFHAIFAGSAPEWERIKITADACPRISSAFLAEQREAMGDYWYLSEYMCEFLAPETGLFSPDSIRAIFCDIEEYDI